jgi:DNA topoisomerase-1
VENKYEKISKTYQYLVSMKQDSVLDYRKIEATFALKDTKPHYTEARLVQLLEDHGIGRPSTFSSLIDKIQERGYVKKENIPGKKRKCTHYILEANELTEHTTECEFGNEKNKLVIQPLGIIVIEFLLKWFNELFHYDYTKEMENELDLISKGEQHLSRLCHKYYTEMSHYIDAVKNEKKIEIYIDENHVFLIGKKGPVIKYIDPNDKTIVEFKQVIKDIDMNKLENGEYTLEELLVTNKPKIQPLGKYQTHDLFVKKGQFGIYAEWGTNKQSLKSFGNRPIENITYIEVLTLLEQDGLLDRSKPIGVIRQVTPHISIRNGKFGDYIFYKTNKMKQPQFFKLFGFKGDYKKGELSILQKWIKDTYHVE